MFNIPQIPKNLKHSAKKILSINLVFCEVNGGSTAHFEWPYIYGRRIIFAGIPYKECEDGPELTDVVFE